MTRTLKLELLAYVRASVGSNFAMFSNPRARGKNFTWDKFPEIASRMAASQVALNIVIPNPKYKVQAAELVEAEARSFAKHLVNEMRLGDET